MRRLLWWAAARLIALAGLSLMLILVTAVPAAAGPRRPGPYAPPVDAPVLDPFRPPSSPYGPGNRGIEYDTEPGTPVRAAGTGVVTFAGAVARSLHVTVSHRDGIRTSYSYLAEIYVVRGQPVRVGEEVGTAGARLHLGARRGETYIDPASLWAVSGPPRVELVPLDGGGAVSRWVSPLRGRGFWWRWW